MEKEPTKQAAARKIASAIVQAMSGPWLAVLASFLLLLLLAVGLAWVCWFWWMPGLWSWGFDTFSWRSVPAALGAFYLAIGPLLVFGLFPGLLEFWQEFGSLSRQVKSARRAQQKIEQKLLEDDPQNLVMIVSYSRQMLSEYYGIAMSQAQRSFRYCLIAMWLGFFVLIAGVLDNFVPLAALLSDTLPGTEGKPIETASVNPNDLVLITGVVIEFIAAAFLWVYRFSIQQQTYYYQRQLKLHNVLLAQRLSEGMGQAKDDGIKMIVQRLLEEAEPKKIDPPSTAGIGKLLKPK